jgi:hypothetical protein
MFYFFSPLHLTPFLTLSHNRLHCSIFIQVYKVHQPYSPSSFSSQIGPILPSFLHFLSEYSLFKGVLLLYLTHAYTLIRLTLSITHFPHYSTAFSIFCYAIFVYISIVFQYYSLCHSFVISSLPVILSNIPTIIITIYYIYIYVHIYLLGLASTHEGGKCNLCPSKHGLLHLTGGSSVPSIYLQT